MVTQSSHSLRSIARALWLSLLLVGPAGVLAAVTGTSTVMVSDIPTDRTADCDALLSQDVDVCNVFVEFDDPSDRLLVVGFASIQTMAPGGLIQVGGGNTAPDESAVSSMPALACDSFVTVGQRFVPPAATDCTATAPDFNSTSFNTQGLVAGSWYCDDPLNTQVVAGSDLRTLVAQLTVPAGWEVAGEITLFANSGVQSVAAAFVCGQCTSFADCADLDGDNVRDDNCMFWECNEGSCLGTTIPIADMGGQFGSCFPDGTADGNDRFHALNCFSDMSTTSGPGYPCEDSPPKAYNVDAGGPFGDCSPDGVCDGNDAFHALNAFQGSTTCSCPSGPAPQLPRPPVVVAEASIQLQVNPHTLLPGESVEVDVYLADSTPDLRGYQLHVGVRGGETGLLDLVDIVVHERKDAAFAGLAAWQAFNIGTRQMVAGIDMAGVETVANAYLATFIFRSSPDAAGAFVIDLLHDESDRSQRTFLFPTPESGKIEVAEAVPAVVEVVAPSARRGRVAAD